ncbi:protein phosphatase 2C 57 [Tanacetum coccineum]
MALWSPRLQRFILNNNNNLVAKIDLKKNILTSRKWSSKSTGRCCSAIAIDAPSSLSNGVSSGIRWGSAKLQGAREEMEDDAVIVSNNDLDGFFFAVVFDGHAGFSFVKFLREELYKEFVKSLQLGQLLNNKDYKGIKIALQEAFENADAKLLNCFRQTWWQVLSQSGKAEELTDSHKPYGRSKASLQEIKRIREAEPKLTQKEQNLTLEEGKMERFNRVEWRSWHQLLNKGRYGLCLVGEKIFASMAENGKQAYFVLCIGDDRSDEDMFKIIGNAILGNMLSVNTNVFACTSGQKPRKAKYYLDDTSEVILLLKNFDEATDSPDI